MSAIAGILWLDGAPAQPHWVESMTQAMRARGPDERTCWSSGSVALGHGMLRTTPEAAAEHQPLATPEERFTLVWDGRLDNREPLRATLQAAGILLRNESDAELVLHSFALWRESCLQRLLGDFAFAIWDATERRLFMARDPMGARPLYWAQTPQLVAFASEEEVLASLPGISNAPNEDLIASYFVYAFQPPAPDRSWLRDIFGLRAAHFLLANAEGKVTTERYWHLEPGPDNVYASDQECEEAFLEVFGEAVRCRLRGQGDVAMMMSGGMDSASIGAMVRRLLPEFPGKALHTYSAISDQPETCVESQCILSLTNSLATHAHSVSVPSFTGMLDVADLMAEGLPRSHPVDNDLLLPALMCLAASRNGHRVVLHGASGDLATHALHRYPAYLLRGGLWTSAWNECAEASRHHTYLRGRSARRIWFENLWTAFAPGPAKSTLSTLRSYRSTPALPENCLMSSELALRVGLLRPPARTPRPRSPTLQEDFIRVVTAPSGIASGHAGFERIAGRYGVELRDPWGDSRVVAFWQKLPLHYKVRHGWTKYLVRKTFASDIGAQVSWRSGKEHLGWRFAWRIMQESRNQLKAEMECHLERVGPYIDSARTRACYQAFKAGNAGVDWQSLFHIITLSYWLDLQ